MTVPGGPAGLFDPTSLAELRALVRQTMRATCTVERARTTTGDGGVPVTTWAAVPALSDLPCGFRPQGVPSEALTADAIRAASRLLVRFPVDAFPSASSGTPAAQILPKDRLRITHVAPGLPSPLVLAVIGDQRKAADETAVRVLAERVSAGG